MTPLAYQQAVARICFDASLPQETVADLGGDAARWALYRRMVRSRLRRAAGEGLPRTFELLGDENTRAHFNAFLAAVPPRSRYLRDVVSEFADALVADPNVTAAVKDCAQYEAAKWEVRDRPGDVPADVGTFDFDRVPAVNPVRSCVEVSHAVWDNPETALEEPVSMWIARDTSDRVASVAVRGVHLEVLNLWARGEASAADALHQLASRGLLTVDAAFIDTLCDVLAVWIERGIVLGSVPE